MGLCLLPEFIMLDNLVLSVQQISSIRTPHDNPKYSEYETEVNMVNGMKFFLPKESSSLLYDWFKKNSKILKRKDESR